MTKTKGFLPLLKLYHTIIHASMDLSIAAHILLIPPTVICLKQFNLYICKFVLIRNL